MCGYCTGHKLGEFTPGYCTASHAHIPIQGQYSIANPPVCMVWEVGGWTSATSHRQWTKFKRNLGAVRQEPSPLFHPAVFLTVLRKKLNQTCSVTPGEVSITWSNYCCVMPQDNELDNLLCFKLHSNIDVAVKSSPWGNFFIFFIFNKYIFCRWIGLF